MFVCENNKYGMGTSAERSSSNTEYFTRGDKIPGIQANGMDIIAVHQAVKFAKQWAVDGKGPLLLEFVTYRYGGHSYVSFIFQLATLSFVYILDFKSHANWILGCRIPELPTVLVRRFSACALLRTRYMVCSVTLRNGASRLRLSSRYGFLIPIQELVLIFIHRKSTRMRRPLSTRM